LKATNYVIEVLVAFKKRKPPDDDLRIETYVGVYIFTKATI
jgi:hypothetical protein